MVVSMSLASDRSPPSSRRSLASSGSAFSSPFHPFDDRQNRSKIMEHPSSATRALTIRALALLCACSLSIGSHYASYILGPLKTRLSKEMGTSNTEFSLLIAAFTLNSTWTPLLGGFMAGHLGTTVSSIIATGLIFLGQIILFFGDIMESVRLMTFGMFVFGLGVSPLAVVQESIIVRFFKHHGLGLSLALGLVVGKASSFVSARTSYPLSENFGPRAPFLVATLLAGFSFTMNLVYLSVSKWLVTGSGTELEANELHQKASQVESVSEAQALKQVAEKRKVHLRDITKLGDVFWAYITINILCGAIWTPFTHLAPNIIQTRYNLSDLDASDRASYLLAGSVFLYPICGYITDRLKKGPILHQLFLLSSALTLLCYLWLALPPHVTGSPNPSIALYAIGQGFAPLLLVIIVPTLVSSKYVPTTLGAHKSLEQTGSTIFQTFAGVFLDKMKKSGAEIKAGEDTTSKFAVQELLNLFLFLNICQFGAIIFLWFLDRRRKMQAALAAIQFHPPADDDSDDFNIIQEEEQPTRHSRTLSFAKQEQLSEPHCLDRRDCTISSQSSRSPLLEAGGSAIPYENTEEERPLLSDEILPWHTEPEEPVAGEARTKAEIFRGEVCGVLCICLICFAWVFFISTAFLKLRSKEDRKST